MDIEFKNKKMKKIYEDHSLLSKKYGSRQAEEIISRINELKAAESLFDISKIPQARLHSLYNNWKDHYAVDIKHPYRLVLFPLNGNNNDLRSITAIKIAEMIDYH